MQIHILQFDERVGPGTFFTWLTELADEIAVWRCDHLQFPPVDTLEPLLLLGGHMGVNDAGRLPYLQQTADWLAPQIEGGRPVLAICLGGQLLAHSLGGRVDSQSCQEKGRCELNLTVAGRTDPLFTGLPDPFVSFAWHNDSFALPAGSQHLASSRLCPNQAFRYRNAWGVQFHPEVDAEIVAGWCQRSDGGTEPLKDFQAQQTSYFAHSRQLLANYWTECLKINSAGA